VEPREEHAVQDPLREVVRVVPHVEVVLEEELLGDDRRRPVEDLALDLNDPDTVRMTGVSATPVQSTAIARNTMRVIRNGSRGRWTVSACVRVSVAI